MTGGPPQAKTGTLSLTTLFRVLTAADDEPFRLASSAMMKQPAEQYLGYRRHRTPSHRL